MLLYVDLAKAKKHTEGSGQLGLFAHAPAPGHHVEPVRVAAHTRHTPHGEVTVPSHTRLVMKADATPHPDHVAAAKDAFERMSRHEDDDLAHAEGGRTMRHPARAASRRAYEQAKAEFDQHPKHVQDAAVRASVDEQDSRRSRVAGKGTGFNLPAGHPPVKVGQYVRHPSSREWFQINHVEPSPKGGQDVYGSHRPQGPGNSEADRAELDAMEEPTPRSDAEARFREQDRQKAERGRQRHPEAAPSPDIGKDTGPGYRRPSGR